jgi:hypothetical protein
LNVSLGADIGRKGKPVMTDLTNPIFQIVLAIIHFVFHCLALLIMQVHVLSTLDATILRKTVRVAPIDISEFVALF